MNKGKGRKIVNWTDEEIDLLESYIRNHPRTGFKDCEELANTINECKWNGKSVRTPKAVTLRMTKIRNSQKGKPTRKITKSAELKESKSELNMTELGEAIHDYIASLKKQCQDLAIAVSDEQIKNKEITAEYKSIVKEKEEIIVRLNKKISHLNANLHQNYSSSKTFKLEEIVR